MFERIKNGESIYLGIDNDKPELHYATILEDTDTFVIVIGTLYKRGDNIAEVKTYFSKTSGIARYEPLWNGIALVDDRGEGLMLDNWYDADAELLDKITEEELANTIGI